MKIRSETLDGKKETGRSKKRNRKSKQNPKEEKRLTAPSNSLNRVTPNKQRQVFFFFLLCLLLSN